MTENQQKDNNEKNENSFKSVVNPSKDVKDLDKCAICLTTITEPALTDSCSHEFCFDCISQWSANHNRCPICRQTYSNIKYNIVSNESFDLLAVEERPEAEDEEIEAILHRMLLYLRLIGLRNRTQRRRDAMRTEMTTIEESVKKCDRKTNQKQRLNQKIEELKSQIRQLDEEIRRFNHTLSAESPSEEELLEALDGRENEIEDIEVIDIIFDPDELVVPVDQEVAEEDSFDSMPSLVSVDDSGNESDDEQESEEPVVTRKRKPSPQTRNTDSDDLEHSSPKRKRNRRQ